MRREERLAAIAEPKPRSNTGHQLCAEFRCHAPALWLHEQESSQIGYNPQKRGRPSHHPLLAFLSEARRLLWVTLRPGKTGTANGCIELLQQALPLLPAGHRVALIRVDAGFFLTRLWTFLESQDLPYIIMACLTAVLRHVMLHRLPETAWRRVSKGMDVAEYMTTLPSWAGQN